MALGCRHCARVGVLQSLLKRVRETVLIMLLVLISLVKLKHMEAAEAGADQHDGAL